MRKFLRRVARRLRKFAFRPFSITKFVFPHEEARKNGDVRNVRVLIPAQRVEIASPRNDPFVPVGRFYREGWFDRPDVFVCEIPDAYLHVGTGMACTRHWKVIADLDYRVPYFEEFGALRPRRVERLAGTFAAVSSCFAWNHYHWMIDCLPKIITLARAEPERPITLLAPDDLGPVQRESLATLLPPHFTVARHPPGTWLQVETLLWPSLLTGRCNALLPADYYEAIRRPIFARFGLPAVHERKARLYLSRRSSGNRRILNEEALLAFLAPYGFRMVEVEKLTFREQVELFHRADVVVAPHGAGLNLLLFAGPIAVVVLHPDRHPQNHFHTLARGLGQDHYFTTRPSDDREANFDADLPKLRQIFDQLGLRPLV